MPRITKLLSLAVTIPCLLLPAGCGSGSPASSSDPGSSVSITTSSLPTATIGTAYSATVVAANGVKPYTFSLSSGLLPAGFTLSPDGVLAGMPSIAGTYNFVVSVTDATALKTSTGFSLTIAPPAGTKTVSISTAALPSGTAGTPYNTTIAAANGTAPYTFALTSGVLPSGLSLSSAGVLSGTPTTAGTSTFTVGVVDAGSQRASATYNLTIAPAAVTLVTISTATLPSGTAGTAYSTSILAANGVTPYSFAITSGTLPSGLSLSTSGIITGTPTAAGASAFTVTVTDAMAQKASAPYTLSIAAAAVPVSITTASLPTAVAGATYNATILAANGTAPYRYTISAGALPAGLILATNGVLSGAPTSAGTSTFSITVTDANALTATANYTLTVGSALFFPLATLPSGEVGVPLSAILTASGGTAPYTFSATQSTLPTGLTLSSTGVLSGTPATAGTTSIPVTVTDSASQQVTTTFSINVVPTVSLAASTPPSGTVGVLYSTTVSAANGKAPYTYAITSGALPTGLVLSSNGTISGTPATAGTFSYTVTATDANVQRASQMYAVTIAPALAITTTSLPAGIAGSAYSSTIQIANGTQPYTLQLNGGALPAGLMLSSAGVLSGTPTAAGSSTFTVTATDAASQHASATYTVTIAPSLVLANSTLPSGIVGAAYNATLQAANGTAPYSFAVSSGSLPAGLTLSGAIISGTPTTAGTSTFTIRATDASSQSATMSYTVTIAPALTITTPALGPGQVGSAYSDTFFAANGTAPYTFAVTSGSLPSGFTLASNGSFSGTPTSAGTSTFTVMATDSAGQHATANYSLTIVSPLTITTPALGPGQVGSAYSATFFAANGTAPYTFAVTSGALPGGFTLASNGALSGTPTAAGTSTFTITATDATGKHATANYSLTIGSPLAITTPSLGPGQVGSAYSATFFVANGTSPYSFAVTSGSLPSALTLTSSGVLSGAPTTAGTSTFTVTVTDATGAQATANYSLTIAPNSPITLTTPALGPGQVGNSYTATFYAANGTAPYAFNVTSGALPNGFILALNGALSGTPTTAGTYNFTVTATDATGTNGRGNYSLTINPSGNSTGGGSSAPQSLQLTQTTLPNAPLNGSYNDTLDITGGTQPYIVSLTGGALPAGLTLSPRGVLTGTATTNGANTFTVSVADSSSPQLAMSATLSLTVSDPTHATVTVDAATVVNTVPQTMFGLHTSVYDGLLSASSAVQPFLNTAGITVLRYPGGSYSDRYHWAQNSITPIHASDPGACGALTTEVYLGANADFGHFVKTMQAAGADALITVNYGTSVANSSAALLNGSDGTTGRCSDPNTAGQPQEAAAWVAYANGDASSTQVIGQDAVGFDWKTVGFWASLRSSSSLAVDDGYNFLRIGQSAPLNIKNWEIGNELYYNGWDGNRNFESDLHAPFTYPNGYSGGSFLSRDQVPALGPTAYGTNAIPFIQAMKAVDPTIKIGLDMSSPTVDPIDFSWNPSVMQGACAGTNFDIAVIHYYPGTYQNMQASEMLGLPQSDLPYVVGGIRTQLAQYCPANAANMKVYITETSPNGTVNPSVPFPVYGLYTLNIYMSALETGISNVDWLELHNGTFLDSSETPGPSFYGIQLGHLLAGVGDRLVKSTSSTTNVLAHATVKSNGQKGILLTNADPTNPVVVQVTVTGTSLGSAATQYSYGVATTQSAPALTGSAVNIPGNTFSVTVPAYTAVEVLIP